MTPAEMRAVAVALRASAPNQSEPRRSSNLTRADQFDIGAAIIDAINGTAPAPFVPGDFDGDGDLDVLDVTLSRRKLAGEGSAT